MLRRIAISLAAAVCASVAFSVAQTVITKAKGTPTPAAATPDPKIAEKAKPFETVIENVLTAYNAGDAATFAAEFGQSAVPPMNAANFKAIFQDIHMPELGHYVSCALAWKETTPDPDRALIVCDAKFEKSAKVKVSANFTRENGAVKLVQLRFERNDGR